MAPAPPLYARLRKPAIALAVVVLATLAAIALGVGRADGAKVTVMGAAAPAQPACPAPDGSCIVEARVTGFQTAVDGRKKPFVAPFAGKIVAWSIKLGKPDRHARNCFESGCKGFVGFGGPAQARLAILKPIRKEIKQGHPIYQLLRQSPVENLTPFFGSTITFTLQNPLLINEGQIAALTVPTWAPMFATGMGRGSTWRASRKKTKKRGGCFVRDANGNIVGANVKSGSPVQKIGSQRSFACQYGGNRLLYSATMVKKPVTKK
jgi:hypothetical protein